MFIGNKDLQQCTNLTYQNFSVDYMYCLPV